jgi:hypothetical protein
MDLRYMEIFVKEGSRWLLKSISYKIKQDFILTASRGFAYMGSRGECR